MFRLCFVIHWRMCRIAIGVVVLALLIACQPRAPESLPDSSALPSLQPAKDAVHYTVQPGQSWVRILVYRDGRLAALGHNHVIHSTALSGELYVTRDPARSILELRLPVASLSVDDPAQRRAAGEDFAAVPDAEAIAGTRRNMLGEGQLEASAWPEILLRSAMVDGDWSELQLHMDVQLRGALRRITVPAGVTRAGGQLVATGDFAVTQSELGLTPFSVMLGALQVRDTLEIGYRIVAEIHP